MKAMILAAGLGTRLKPLTDTIPKALVEVGGKPMLENVILTLKSQGFDKIVVNVHHFARQVEDFLKNKDYGIEIKISDETNELLDTGGGIVKAFPLLFKDDDSPVLIHNVDIIGKADLLKVMKEVEENKGASLLVSERESSRKLIFDNDYELKGWHDLKSDKYRPKNLNLTTGDISLAFSGIYALSKRSIEEMKELMGEGKFSVIDYFLHPLRKVKICGVLQKDLSLIDIGKPATLLQARYILNNCKYN